MREDREKQLFRLREQEEEDFWGEYEEASSASSSDDSTKDESSRDEPSSDEEDLEEEEGIEEIIRVKVWGMMMMEECS